MSDKEKKRGFIDLPEHFDESEYFQVNVYPLLKQAIDKMREKNISYLICTSFFSNKHGAAMNVSFLYRYDFDSDLLRVYRILRGEDWEHLKHEIL